MNRLTQLICSSLTVILLTTYPLYAQETDNFIGSWIGGEDPQLVFEIKHAENRMLTGSVDSPDQNIFGIPVSRIETEGDHLTLYMESIDSRFTGVLSADGSEIAGKLIVNDKSFPITLSPLSEGLAAALPKHPTDERPEAKPADVSSPDAIVKAAYDVISGPSGEEPNWDRFRSLFLPEARLIWTGRRAGGIPTYNVRTPEEYVDQAPRNEGFFESEVHAVNERFGDIAHVFSTYESRRSPDATPFAKGINSFQLWFDGDRWWIVNLYWHAEREGAAIPERYMREQ